MKTLRKTFVHYFVPHKRNTYQPHFLRPEIAGLVAVAIVVLFLGSIAQSRFVAGSQSAAVVASSLVDLANADRAQSGLPPLDVNVHLQEAAQLKADDMAHYGYFAHTSPTGKDPWYWFQQAGYDFSYAGENLAVYFSDSSDVNNAWMNSPEHRGNILDPNYTQVGIAIAQGMYQGYETTFVVQEFGAPASSAASAVASDAATSAAVQPVASAQAPAPAPVPASIPNPEVAGASAPPASAVKIVSQDAEGISVKNENAVLPNVAPTPTAANPIETFLLRLITSPASDLTVAYECIGAVVALALLLEIGVELERQHPRRIAVGVSLIALMLVLVYADHAFFVGKLLIA